MKRSLLSVLLIVFAFLAVNGQEVADTNFANIRKNAISFNLFGTTPLLGVSYERLLSNKVSVECGVGIPSIGVGIKYYPYKVKQSKASLYLGLTTVLFNSGDNEITGANGSLFYFPVGFSYFGNKGFNFGLDGGLAVVREDIFTTGYPYINIKLGRRF